jgi:hypothetical protein
MNVTSILGIYFLSFFLIRRRAVLLIPCGSVLCVHSNFNGSSPNTLSLYLFNFRPVGNVS